MNNQSLLQTTQNLELFIKYDKMLIKAMKKFGKILLKLVLRPIDMLYTPQRELYTTQSFKRELEINFHIGFEQVKLQYFQNVTRVQLEI